LDLWLACRTSIRVLAFADYFTWTLSRGCFCFYRLRSLKNKALIISPTLLKEYARDRVFTLHQKNLLSLGEDRYLTTLVLKSFPYMKTCFNGRAKCKTIVPDQWSVLLSQRRRWINSTVHNLWELMSVKQLCGCFCFSMRFIIMMDFVSTILQPASILYIGYLIYVLVTESNSFPLISIIMLAGA
jgi:chitin synthase